MASKKKYNKDQLRLGSQATQISTAGLALGIGGLIVALVIGYWQGEPAIESRGQWGVFLHSYLIGFSFWISVAAGALWFVLIQHLVQATWSVTVRRTAELLTAPFGVLGVLSLVIILPIILGNDDLYLWSNPEIAASDHLIHEKGMWFSGPFFGLRLAAYISIMTAISWWFRKQSVAQDQGGHADLTGAMRKWSAPSMLVFALTLALMGFDLLMSVEPRWFSTMFGLYFFAGCGVAFYASLSILPMLWQKLGLAKNSITTEHFHDSGNMLFAFVFFWAYIAFSQYMLIWYANIPEETAFFRHRLHGSWQPVAIILLLLHFVVPFLALMSRHIKRRRAPLAVFAVWLLVMHWVDLYWLVMPAYGNPENPAQAVAPSFWSALTALSATVGVGGLFFWALGRAAKHVNIIPTGDPRLAKSVAFENK